MCVCIMEQKSLSSFSSKSGSCYSTHARNERWSYREEYMHKHQRELGIKVTIM